MNDTDRLELRSFESDVRQLLKDYRGLKSDLKDMRTELSKKDAEIERLKSELRAEKRAYSTLKTARMLEVSDSDLKESKQRITRLVREVNKCIRLLSAETIVGEEDITEEGREGREGREGKEGKEGKDDSFEEEGKDDSMEEEGKDDSGILEEDALEMDDSGMRSLFGDDL